MHYCDLGDYVRFSMGDNIVHHGEVIRMVGGFALVRTSTDGVVKVPTCSIQVMERSHG